MLVKVCLMTCCCEFLYWGRAFLSEALLYLRDCYKGGSQITVGLQVTPEVLYCAKKAGVTHVLKAGGAQAVAALAWGTESCPKVCHLSAAFTTFFPNSCETLKHLPGIGMSA